MVPWGFCFLEDESEGEAICGLLESRVYGARGSNEQAVCSQPRFLS